MKALTSSLLGLFAAPVLAGLLGAYVPLASAAPPKEIRIAVPDVSAGSSHSGGGVVDVLYTRQLLEKEFANDGIAVKWSFFKGAGPVVNEAFANGQVDFAYLGDLAAIIGKSGGLDSRLLAATARGSTTISACSRAPGSRPWRISGQARRHLSWHRQPVVVRQCPGQRRSQREGPEGDQPRFQRRPVRPRSQADRCHLGPGRTVRPARPRARGNSAEHPRPERRRHPAGAAGRSGAFVDAHPDITERLLKVQLQAQDWLAREENRDAYIELVSKQASYPVVILQSEYRGRKLGDALSPRLDADFLGRLDASIQAAKRSA